MKHIKLIDRLWYWLRGGDQIHTMTRWHQQGYVPLVERENILWMLLLGIPLTLVLAISLVFSIPVWLIRQLWARIDEWLIPHERHD